MTTLSDRLRIRRTERQTDTRAGGLRRTPFSYIGLIVLALYTGLPLVVLVFNSLKTRLDLGLNPLGFPSELDFQNYSQAWVQGGIGQGLLNSAFLVAGTIVGVWICAGLAAYSLARLDLPAKKAFGNYFFVVISLPVQAFLVPLFFLWVKLGLTNTLVGLMIIYIALNTPFATLLLRTFMVGLPRELEEAARIDGANEWQVATRIILPLARPGFLTIGLVVGLAAYNELLFAITFITTPSELPMSTAFLNFSQGHETLYGLVNAAGVIVIAPVVILFLFMQRRFISGLASGATKG